MTCWAPEGRPQTSRNEARRGRFWQGRPSPSLRVWSGASGARRGGRLGLRRRACGASAKGGSRQTDIPRTVLATGKGAGAARAPCGGRLATHPAKGLSPGRFLATREGFPVPPRRGMAARALSQGRAAGCTSPAADTTLGRPPRTLVSGEGALALLTPCGRCRRPGARAPSPPSKVCPAPASGPRRLAERGRRSPRRRCAG